ncbi:MAG: GDP-mannose mannosyl hydrolase [Burkholderiaceae bacterium]|nr:GDP-mannose mannosyl hydrolase [Burkholderiaceae bacterium]
MPTPPERLPRDTLLTVVQHAPLVSVDLICRDPDGRVLLGWRRNRPAQGSWFVPGGRILKGERVAAALRRIAAAELGLAAQALPPAEFLRAWEHLYDDNFAGVPGIGTHYVVLAYQLNLDAAQARDLLPDTQHGELRWFEVEALRRDPQVHLNSRAYFDPELDATRIP